MRGTRDESPRIAGPRGGTHEGEKKKPHEGIPNKSAGRGEGKQKEDSIKKTNTTGQWWSVEPGGKETDNHSRRKREKRNKGGS